MEEKRKSKRVPFNLTLAIESLYTEGNKETIQLEEEVTVTNISNTGMGFICEEELPMNHYFNAKITIDEERMFYCVLKIVRSKKLNKGYQIGCQFVGLAQILSTDIDDYVTELGDE
ncbi:MAG: PilZ domain-containing protein [Bacillota bacterium]